MKKHHLTKNLLVINLLLAGTMAVQAESSMEKPLISIGGELGLSMGKPIMKDKDGKEVKLSNDEKGRVVDYTHGLGLSAQVEVPIVEHFNATASVGYTSFALAKDAKNYREEKEKAAKATPEWTNLSKEKKDEFSTSPSGLIPVKIGAKYYILEQVYVGVEVGGAFPVNLAKWRYPSFKKSNFDASGDLKEEYEHHKFSFAFAPGVGAFIPVGSNGGGVDVGVRYENWIADWFPKQVALRLAYKFGI